MELVNHKYKNFAGLKIFFHENSVQNSDSSFIQIFSSNIDYNCFLNVKKELQSILPNVPIIATSTAEIVSDGKIIDNEIIISVSIFEHSIVKSESCCKLSIDEMVERISNSLITDKTKLLLCFADFLKINSEQLLKKLTQKHPTLVIAGGNAADDAKYVGCCIFSDLHKDCDAVFVAIDSDVLQVTTKSLLNWHTIGRELNITKSEGLRLYEIDNKPALDIYEHYLGKEIRNDILTKSTEFPLIFNDNGVDVARAPIAVYEDGSMTLVGELKEGTKVKFGFADIDYIEEHNSKLLDDLKYKDEAIYIYTCTARRSMLGNYLDEEIATINKIAPTVGFVTYGEFFHDIKSSSTNLLNITTTYVILNESQKKHEYIKKVTSNSKNKDDRDITLKALTTLAKKTSEELEEYKLLLINELDLKSHSLEYNLNYARQYEDAINSKIAILKTDTNNIITHANEKFCELSKYTLEELIGKNCQELRHEKYKTVGTCNEIKKLLEEKKSFKKVLINIAKDGTEYTVNNLFYSITDLDGKMIEYIQIMYDLTEIVKLNEEITNTQKEVVLTMGAIGEKRSKETGLHVKRVSEYSYLLAKVLGMNEDEANLLKQASPMHDIGKVGIPDSILNKPGKLTFEEFEIMKTHAEIGYEMLKHSERPILKASSIVAKTHHEKWDGSGYPLGIKGKDIHIFGRITAIADVFDALNHDRVYKKAWDIEDVLELFKKERGLHFDPKLIDLFFQNLDKFLEIKDNLKD